MYPCKHGRVTGLALAPMSSRVAHLITALNQSVPQRLPSSHAFFILATAVTLVPIAKLHLNQRSEPNQKEQTGWLRSIILTFKSLYSPLDPSDRNRIKGEQRTDKICGDLPAFYSLLGIDLTGNDLPDVTPPPQILVTQRTDCFLCPPTARFRTLRRKGRSEPALVDLLDQTFTWRKAHLFTAECPTCHAHYFPDKITYTINSHRVARLEYDLDYLRVSKRGVWVHRRVAVAQEKAIQKFHAGWSTFSEWLNGTLGERRFTIRQAHRMFLEHFARRLLVDHKKDATFTCDAQPSTRKFAESLRNALGRDGGSVPSSFHHGCLDCTHKKRYREDLVAEGLVLDNPVNAVADIPQDLLERAAVGFT